MVERSQFIKEPYDFTRVSVGEVRAGQWISSKQEVEKFLSEAHGDKFRGQDLGSDPKIRSTAFPSRELDTREPMWKDVEEAVKKASAPWPSALLFKGYRKYPLLLSRLSKLLQEELTNNLDMWLKAAFF